MPQLVWGFYVVIMYARNYCHSFGPTILDGVCGQAYIQSMEGNVLRFIYTFFLGIMLALFVGLGISTFYEGPKQPDAPISIESKTPTPQQEAANRQYEQQFRAYEKQAQSYSRNVSIIALICSIILLVASFLMERFTQIITNGLLLGGLFTLLYSVIRGFASQDNKMTFITVSVGLVVAIYLGYQRFSRHTKLASKHE